MGVVWQLNTVVEYAARKLRTIVQRKVTRDHYIVPDDKELERENDYGRSNIAKSQESRVKLCLYYYGKDDEKINWRELQAILDKEFWSFEADDVFQGFRERIL